MGEADERIGSLVDERYKVLEAMASGSMGSVYKARRSRTIPSSSAGSSARPG
jgi:hypothetical protein